MVDDNDDDNDDDDGRRSMGELIKRISVIDPWSHLTLKINKYDITDMRVHFFDALLHFFFLEANLSLNAIIRVEVCGALTWFLNRN